MVFFHPPQTYFGALGHPKKSLKTNSNLPESEAIVLKQTNNPASPVKRRKATTPEARENQMIAAAVDLAEQQLLNGTASSAVIVHYLRLGTDKSRHENAILAAQEKLIEAKTEQLKSAKRMDELYANALKAMSRYHGDSLNEDPDLQ